MTKNVTLIGLLLLIFALPGCDMKDGVDECPAGDVRLHFYVEKFRNKSQNALDDREDIFGDIVTHFRYFLYKDGTLHKQGIIDNFQATTGNNYTLDFTDLDYGNYEMVVVANSTHTALSGDAAQSANLVVKYPGSMDTEDYFSAVYPFSVNSDKTMEYDVGLSRMQGVIRYNFRNMPADITAMEIAIENVTSEKWITGDYKTSYQALRTYDIIPVRQTGDDIRNSAYIMGTFPTLEGEYATYHLNLFRDGESIPYRSERISDNLTVARNQLLDLLVTFNADGSFKFEVLLDNEWGGSNPGGETGID